MPSLGGPRSWAYAPGRVWEKVIALDEVTGYVGAPDLWQITVRLAGEDRFSGQVHGAHLDEAFELSGWQRGRLRSTLSPNGPPFCLDGERTPSRVELYGRAIGPGRFVLQRVGPERIKGRVLTPNVHGLLDLRNSGGLLTGTVSRDGKTALDLEIPCGQFDALCLATMAALAYERAMVSWIATAWAE